MARRYKNNAIFPDLAIGVPLADGSLAEIEHLPVGAALENFPACKRKKKFRFHVRKKNTSQKNVTNHEAQLFVHPRNRRFPLSTMVADIHL